MIDSLNTMTADRTAIFLDLLSDFSQGLLKYSAVGE